MPKIYTASSFGNIHTTTSRKRTRMRRTYRPNRVGLEMQFDSFFSKLGSLNKFYFQIIGMTMVTVAVVLIFYSAFEFTSPGADAGSSEDDNIRILTNFQKGDYSRSASAQLVEIQQENRPENTEEQTPVVSEYIVGPGESLSLVSANTGVEIETLIQYNNLQEPYSLDIGQKILVP